MVILLQNMLTEQFWCHFYELKWVSKITFIFPFHHIQLHTNVAGGDLAVGGFLQKSCKLSELERLCDGRKRLLQRLKPAQPRKKNVLRQEWRQKDSR